MLRVSEVAERSGVPVSTLRFYEASGLLPAGRSAAGYRLFGDEVFERLAFIGAGKHLGLSLKEIAGVLRVWESGACSEVKADMRPLIAARLAGAERRVAELAAFTTALGSALAELDALPDRRGRCDETCGYRRPLPPAPRAVTRVAASSGPRRGVERPGRPAVPIACSLSAGDAAERARRWRGLLAGADRVHLPDGVRLTLPAERIGAVAELAAAEARCCPFLDFRLHPDAEAVHVEIRAPEDAAGLLADLIGAEREGPEKRTGAGRRPW